MKATSFQFILLGVFGALALAGMVVFALVQSGATHQVTAPVVIWGTFDGPIFSSELRTLSDNDPTYLSVSYVQKDAATYDQELTKAFASGTGPDLFMLRQDYALHSASEISPVPLTAISASQFTDLFVESARPFLSSDGVLAIPLLADPLVLYSNRSLLSTAGVAQPPQWWDQLPDMVAKLSKKDDAGNITQSAIALGEYDNVDNAKDIISLLSLQAGTTITTRNSSGKLVSVFGNNALGTSAGMQGTVDFYTRFANPSNPQFYTWNKSFTGSRAAFVAGKLAMYIGYASEARVIHEMNPNLDVQVSGVPQIRNTSRAVAFAHVYGLAAPKTSKYLANAEAFAARLGASPIALEFSSLYEIPAARRDVLGTEVSSTTLGSLHLSASQVIASYSWLDPDPVATNNLFRDMIESIVSGASPIQEALQKADAQMNQAITTIQTAQ